MRSEDKKQSSMLVLMSPETRLPQTHPLRAIKRLADAALVTLSPVFDAMYAEGGRPSIPPERLLKSMLLMALYSVRSERQFCEQLAVVNSSSSRAHSTRRSRVSPCTSG
jgi:transposase